MHSLIVSSHLCPRAAVSLYLVMNHLKRERVTMMLVVRVPTPIGKPLIVYASYRFTKLNEKPEQHIMLDRVWIPDHQLLLHGELHGRE